MEHPIWNRTVLPSFDGVTQTLKSLMSHLENLGISGTAMSSIELATAEVLNNCVEHGAGRSTSPEIDVQCSVQADQVIISISENGVCFPVPSSERAARQARRATEALAEGGFGWHLIHELSDTVSFSRIKNRNYLELRFSKFQALKTEIEDV